MNFPKRPRPSKKRYFIGVIPDTHVGYSIDTPTYSIPAWDIAIQALWHHVKRLTHIVILGDFGNCESVAHWQSLRADQVFIREDVTLMKTRLDEIRALNAYREEIGMPPIELIFCEGNHEAWCSQLEAKYPLLRDELNLKRRLGFDQPHHRWIPENHFWAIGDIHFTHGHYRGDLLRQGISVIHGHDHTLGVTPLRTVRGEIEKWSFGCLASIDPPPPYARGKHPESWVHGLGWVRVRSNGQYQVDYTRIFDEAWTELPDGTELRVDTKACQKRYDEDQRIRDGLRAEYADRFYDPGGSVVRTEPHHGKTDREGDGSSVARNRRARVVRLQPPVAKGGSL